MGARVSQLVQEEQPIWEGPHTLNVDKHLQAEQSSLISKLQSDLKLCMVCTKYRGLDIEHFFITDGSLIIEFGDTSLQDRYFRFAHGIPRQSALTVGKFVLADDVRRRLHQVCGATNFSLPLRNSEHLAKFIRSGSWISNAMASDSPLYRSVKDHLGSFAALVNTPPVDLDVTPDTNERIGRVMYHDFVSPYGALSNGRTSTLAEVQNDHNILLLGPTGAGKSTLINALFNEYVAVAKPTPESVTKHMTTYRGSYRDQQGVVKGVNVVDSIGFCDSVIPSSEVVEIVKGFIRTTVVTLHKVIIVCAGRIELEQEKAIKDFMQWLGYNDHKKNFAFVYNKAENMTECERESAVLTMCRKLGADARFGGKRRGEGDEIEFVPFSVATGFPPRASLEAVESDLMALHHAVFVSRSDATPIRLDTGRCQLL